MPPIKLPIIKNTSKLNIMQSKGRGNRRPIAVPMIYFTPTGMIFSEKQLRAFFDESMIHLINGDVTIYTAFSDFFYTCYDCYYSKYCITQINEIKEFFKSRNKRKFTTLSIEDQTYFKMKYC